MEELMTEACMVRRAIRRFGGGFMKAIGNAMDMADIHNLAKIKAAWPDEWKQYLEMGREKMSIPDQW